MARSKNANRKPVAESDIGPRILYVGEKDAPVRVRSGPGTEYPQVSGVYLGDGAHEIAEISDGVGSKTGWGRLSDGRGWVALDFVTKIRN